MYMYMYMCIYIYIYTYVLLLSLSIGSCRPTARRPARSCRPRYVHDNDSYYIISYIIYVCMCIYIYIYVGRASGLPSDGRHGVSARGESILSLYYYIISIHNCLIYHIDIILHISLTFASMRRETVFYRVRLCDVM